MTVAKDIPFAIQQRRSFRCATARDNQLFEILEKDWIDVKATMPKVLDVSIQERRINDIHIQPPVLHGSVACCHGKLRSALLKQHSMVNRRGMFGFHVLVLFGKIVTIFGCVKGIDMPTHDSLMETFRWPCQVVMPIENVGLWISKVLGAAVDELAIPQRLVASVADNRNVATHATNGQERMIDKGGQWKVWIQHGNALARHERIVVVVAVILVGQSKALRNVAICSIRFGLKGAK